MSSESGIVTEPARRLRSYRFALDPTTTQHDTLAQHAGAARWAFNHALAQKLDALHRRQLQIDELVTLGYTEQQARTEAVKVPSKPAIQRRWNQYKGDDTAGISGLCTWWRTVSTYAFQSAFVDADTAWKNWLDSLTGRRAGRRVGKPRFKKKGRAADSFRLYGAIKPLGYRRIQLPRIGSIRLHESAKRLCRALDRGGRIKAITIRRTGPRWHAAVLVDEPDITPGRETQTAPSARQQTAGTIGVDLGINTLAALSTGEKVDNPRHLRKSTKRLVKAQRAYSRTTKGSRRREHARARLARVHHKVAAQRASHLHQLTKRLATSWATIAIEDLNIQGMTATARGTIDQPGKKVRQKAGLNRALLDIAAGEIRRQLDYKTRWYKSQLALCDRWYPSSKTCSTCGTAKTTLTLAERTYTCDSCGTTIDRDINAARNIAQHATPVASGTGETQNARRDHVSPPPETAAAAIDETRRPPLWSPRRSNPPTTPAETPA